MTAAQPSPNSYVVGQWVRGERFYGRNALIDEILNGPRNSLWVLGTRRVATTRELEEALRRVADDL